jgi:cytoskeletal protein RodZ
MKYLKNEQGNVIPIALVLVVVIVIVAILAVRAHNKADQVTSSPTPSAVVTTSTSPTVTPIAATDDELIASSIKSYDLANNVAPASGTTLKLTKNTGSAAEVQVNYPGPSSGSLVLLKKANGTWTVVYAGQNYDSSNESRDGLPVGFVNSSPTMSSLIFTF